MEEIRKSIEHRAALLATSALACAKANDGTRTTSLVVLIEADRLLWEWVEKREESLLVTDEASCSAMINVCFTDVWVYYDKRINIKKAIKEAHIRYGDAALAKTHKGVYTAYFSKPEYKPVVSTNDK